MATNQNRVSYSHLTDLDKRNIIDDWGKSGLTQTAYCKKKKLTMGAFTYWHSKFKKSELEQKKSTTNFSTVKIVNEKKESDLPIINNPPQDVIEIYMLSGHVIKMPQKTEISYIAQLLKVIGG